MNRLEIIEVENGYIVVGDRTRDQFGYKGEDWVAKTREDLADLIMELTKKEDPKCCPDPVLMDRKEL